MSSPTDRRQFLRTALGCAAGCFAAANCPSVASAATEAPQPPAVPKDPEKERADHILSWLSPFVVQEEATLDRAALVKLLEERGELCCRSLDFRQRLIAESKGDVDKLVELMGKIVGHDNCTRDGNTVRLVYPMKECGCGRNPKRTPAPDDPYCECSKANNRKLFATVSGRPVDVAVVESPRRGGSKCVFAVTLS